MNVLIYGAGAVGLGVASCLLKSKAKVDIVARPSTVECLKKDGLVRKGIFGEFHAGPGDFGSATSLDALPEHRYDFILVCTKSFDSENAAKDIQSHANLYNKRTRIVLFQNGWGNAEIFAQYFPKEQIFNARVITGFTRPGPNEVVITVHAQPIHIGSLFSQTGEDMANLCRAIDSGGIPCEPTDAIEKDLWAKMLYNCALNPLGAMLNLPYGALAEDDHCRTIMDNIIKEVFAVMQKAGFQTHWQNADDFLKIFYARLVPDTAGHRSSMLQDITAGKRTEIDALNGAVIRLADAHHIDVPYNHCVYEAIRKKQANEKN
ncbi:MAG: ketopantoate reductase family protein [Planctomycetaceae bacterium]|nr:ketopantoate reductase family protein [Planctomycetaceae bacterium]